MRGLITGIAILWGILFIVHGIDGHIVEWYIGNLMLIMGLDLRYKDGN